jgi:hypothetical protein
MFKMKSIGVPVALLFVFFLTVLMNVQSNERLRQSQRVSQSNSMDWCCIAGLSCCVPLPAETESAR